VAGLPSIVKCATPPDAPLGFGAAAGADADADADGALADACVLAAGADPAGAALPVAPAQPAMTRVTTKTPRIVRMPILRSVI